MLFFTKTSRTPHMTGNATFDFSFTLATHAHVWVIYFPFPLKAFLSTFNYSMYIEIC